MRVFDSLNGIKNEKLIKTLNTKMTMTTTENKTVFGRLDSLRIENQRFYTMPYKMNFIHEIWVDLWCNHHTGNYCSDSSPPASSSARELEISNDK